MMTTIKDWLEELFSDFEERFFNFETVGGAYWIALGLVILLFQNHIVTLVGIGAVIYGVYTFLVNRIKQEKKKKELIEK